MLLAAYHEDEGFLFNSMTGFPVSGPIWAGGAGLPDSDGQFAHGQFAAITVVIRSKLGTSASDQTLYLVF